MPRTLLEVLIFLGAVAALAYGSVFFGLGRLPGDIVVDRGNGFYFYVPFTSTIVVGLILGLVLWLVRR